MINKNDIKKIKTFLQQEDIDFKSDVLLKEFSYFKSGNIVKLLIYPRNKRELSGLLHFLSRRELEYKVVGETSNLLFLDQYTYGVFISLKYFKMLSLDALTNIIHCGSGISLPDLSRKALFWNLSGFEGLEGIPGSVGGAIYMNAGAYGDEIKDTLINVSGLTCKGTSFSLNAKDLEFSNRHSLFMEKNDFIILEASFKGIPDTAENIYERMELFHEKRHKYQDFLYPTLGSIFSNIDIYNELSRQDKLLAFKLRWLRRIYYSKKINRETPRNKKRLNKLICDHFGWTFEKQPFSDKTLNCITNRGQHTADILAYISLLRSHLPSSVRLENEIVDNFLYDCK